MADEIESDDPVLEENLYYSRGRLETILNKWMGIFPLWTGIFLGDLSRYIKENENISTNTEETRSTNSLVENYFGIIKQDIPKKKRLRPAEFVRRQYVNIKGKLSEIETIVPSSKKIKKKSTRKDQEQWKPKRDSSKKKSFYFTPPLRFPKPKDKQTKRKLQFAESPLQRNRAQKRSVNGSSRKELSETKKPSSEEDDEMLLQHSHVYEEQRSCMTYMFDRRFQNPDAATCWLNSCLQLILIGIDHFRYPPNFSSPLGNELFKLKNAGQNLDPTPIKDIIMKEEETRKDRNPKAHFLDLANGQQCVRDFFVALTENQQAWPDVFDIFKFQLSEETVCGNRRCRKESSSTHKPQIYLELDMPPKGSDLSKFVEEHLNSCFSVEDYHCEAEYGGCGARMIAQHSNIIHSTTDKHFLIVVLRRVVDEYYGIAINNDEIRATGDIKITDRNGNEAEYRPIAVIEHRGRINSLGETSGHYLCDIQTKEGNWFRTNDNMKPVHIQVESVSKHCAVVMYCKR